MEKIRSISIALGVLVLCGAAAYYIVILLPKANEQKFVMEQQQKCHDIGEKAYKADLQQYGVDSLEEPQYGYSKKLNTCIYSSGYHDYGNPSAGVGGEILKHNCDAHWEMWVKNSYTNEKIIEVSNWLFKCEWMASLETIEEYGRDKEALFNS